MKRLTIIFGLGVLLTLLTTAAGHAGEVALRISGQFVSGDDQPTGFDVELLERFLAWRRVRKGDDVEVTRTVVQTVPALLEAVQSGRSEMGLGGITITAERDRVVDFSEPYLPVRMVLIAPPGRIGEPWREGLQGKRIAAIIGSTNAKAASELADDIPGVEVDTSFPTNERLFEALEEGTLDGAVVDVTHYWVMGKENNLTLVTPVGPAQGLGVVLPEGSPLKTLWDEFLAEFGHTQAYFQLIKRFFGSDAEEMVRLAKQ